MSPMAALRPLSLSFASLPRVAPKALNALNRSAFARTMSSSSAPKAEWLAIIPDKPNTLAKRLEVRPIHLANVEAIVKTGAMKFGGAILSDIPSDPADASTFDFKGSSLILEAASKADVIAFLKTDVYHKEGVWDVDNVYYLKTAMREKYP